MGHCRAVRPQEVCRAAFTKLLGAASICAITLTDEATARAAAAAWREMPIEYYTIADLMEEQNRQLPAGEETGDRPW